MNEHIVKNYWENKHPGLKRNKHVVGTKIFFNEMEKERYGSIFQYKYIKEKSEFNKYKNKKVLEIGIGFGTEILQYARNGAKVYGIDLTNSAIRMSNKRFKLENLTGIFQQANFKNLPYKDNTFDLVTSFGVLHHSKETQQGINEIYRVLKPGGRFIIMLYHKGFKYYFMKLFFHGVLRGEILKYSSQQIVSRHSENFGNCPLTKVYNRKEAKKMFSRFKQLEMECFRLDDHFRINGKIFSITKFLLPWKIYRIVENKLGWNMLIKGYK